MGRQWLGKAIAMINKSMHFIPLGMMVYERHTVKPPIKDTPKEDKPPNKGQTKSTLDIYTLYKITSERGQPLYKGQNAGSQVCPLFGGSTVLKSLHTAYFQQTFVFIVWGCLC